MKGLNAQLEAPGKNQNALNALSKVKIINSGDKGGLVRAGVDTAARDDAQAKRSADIAERRRQREDARDKAAADRKAERNKKLADLEARREERRQERSRLIVKRAFEEEIALGNRKRNMEANAQSREEQRRIQAMNRAPRENAKAAKREGAIQARNIALLEKHRAKLQSISNSSTAVDRATLAFLRERDAIREAAAVTGDHAKATRALAAAEKKYADALARDAAKSDKMRIKASRETTSFMSNLKGAAGPIGMVVGLLTAMGVAATGAAYGIGKLGFALAENSLLVAQDALKIERQAKMFGLSNKAYQTLRNTMGQFGVDQRDISDMFGQYAQMIKAGAEGQKTASEAFKTLGMDAKKLLKMSPEEQIYALADATQKMGDATLRTAAISTMLGEDLAKKAGPMLIMGAQYMKDMAKQAEELGAIMTDKDIEAARGLTTAFVKISTVVKGLQISIGTKLMPVLIDLANKLLAWYKVNEKIIGQELKRFADDVTFAFDALGRAAHALDRIFGGMSGFFQFVKGMAIGAALFAGMAAAIAALASSPLTVPLGYLTAIALVLQDIYMWFVGGGSILGKWIDYFKNAEGLLGALTRLFVSFAAVGRAALDLIIDGIKSAGIAASPLTDALSKIMGEMGGQWLSNIKSFADVLAMIVDYLAIAVMDMAELMGYKAPALGGKPGTQNGVNIDNADAYGSNQSFQPTIIPNVPIIQTQPSAKGNASARGPVTINIGGPVINGAGIDETKMRALLARHSEETARQVQAGLIGLPV